MSDEAPQRRRLLVALDAAEDAPALLEAAADLAARMHAELRGLFVEDDEMLALGANPLIRTVSSYSSAARAFEAREMERALRRQVAMAREALERAARARRIQASFEVRRGQLLAAIAALEEAPDLVLVRRTAGHAHRLPGAGRQARTSVITRQVVAAVRRPVMILDARTAQRARVVTLYDGSPETEKALIAAAEIAERRGDDGFAVLPLAVDDEAAQNLGIQAGETAAMHGHRVRILPRSAPDVAAIGRAANKLGAAILVLHADHKLLAGDGLGHLLEEVSSSVMVVR